MIRALIDARRATSAPHVPRRCPVCWPPDVLERVFPADQCDWEYVAQREGGRRPATDRRRKERDVIPSLQLVAYEPPVPEPMAWQDRGACRGADPDLFFPGPKQNARQAKKICAECDADVRAECLAYAIDNEPLGVWGGMSPRERLAARTEPMSRASRFVARCGTVGGRSAHQRRNETPCGPCREAYNEHERAKARRRRLEEGRG